MEGFNGFESNKDKRSRGKAKACSYQVGQLVSMIMGDGSYLTMRKWDRKSEVVRKAMDKLQEPQFILQQLKLLMQPIIENTSSSCDVRKALQELESFLKQSKNTVPNQGCASKIHESLPGSIPLEAEALQEAKEESQSCMEELKQLMPILDQTRQSIREARVCAIVANMLQKVVNSCSNIALYDILNQNCANPVQGHHGVGQVTIEIKDEQLRLHFPPTPDSIQINQKGKNAEVTNQEMIVQEKQVKDVILTIGLVVGRLAELKLEMQKTNQEMGNLEVDSTNKGLNVDPFLPILWNLPVSNDKGIPWNLDTVNDLLKVVVPGEGTSYVRANEANTEQSPDEISSYIRNANVLAEILQKHPNITKKFLLNHPDFQSLFMKSLAEIYQKIESKLEILELKDIMEVMVQDMELTSLQISSLKEMLAKVRERLKDLAERKRLLEEIDSLEDKREKAKQKLAELEKKSQFV